MLNLKPFIYNHWTLKMVLLPARSVTLQFVIITQFVINYKLRWIATQLNCVPNFKKMRKNENEINVQIKRSLK